MCRFGRKTGGLHGPRPAGAPLSYLERARAAGVQCRPSIRITRLHGNFFGTRVVMAAGEDLYRLDEGLADRLGHVERGELPDPGLLRGVRPDW